jgi:hypothetical protein
MRSEREGESVKSKREVTNLIYRQDVSSFTKHLECWNALQLSYGHAPTFFVAHAQPFPLPLFTIVYKYCFIFVYNVQIQT